MISYSICFSVWLISLTIIPPSPSTLLQMVTFFFFWQSNTPLCVYIYVCVYMYTHTPRTSSLCTRVAHVLAIVTGAAVHIRALVFFGYTPRRKPLDHVFFFFFFWENTILFSTEAAPLYVPIKITNFQKQTWIQIQASCLPMVRWVSEPLKFWGSFSSSMKPRPLQCLTGLRWEGNKVWYRHLEPSLHTAGLLFNRCQCPDFFSCSKNRLRENRVYWQDRGLGLILPFIWSVVDYNAVLVPGVQQWFRCTYIVV